MSEQTVFTVYLIGHKNPDTDSICSSIAYASFKSAVDPVDRFVPARLGPLNRETQFVLDYFRVPAPVLLEHVYAQVMDVAFDKAVSVTSDASMRDTWQLMARSGVKTVNVVDGAGKLVGLITLGDIAEAYLESAEASFGDPVPVRNIVSTLDGVLLLGGSQGFSGKVAVGASASRGTEPVLLIWDGQVPERASLITPGVSVLVAAGNCGVPAGVMSAAAGAGVAVISTPHPTYEAVRLVGQSFPVLRIMTGADLVTFRLDDLIDDAKETMLRHKYRNFPIIDDQGRPVGMLARRHILDYSGKKVILVDHNEKSQSVEGIEQAMVLEIIDHHRIAAVETDQPIVFLNRPLGCTATIVFDLYDQRGMVPTIQVAGLMCSAILSDTLAFKSPTCTPEDVRAAEKLAALAGVDMEEFAKFMFEAGTSLEGRTERDIFYGDFKEFRVGQFRIGVSQVNIYNTRLGPLKSLLIEFMDRERKGRGYDILLLMLTDIINEGSDILVVGNNELVERAFGVNVKGRSFFLTGVISRKKQVIPRLIRAINAM